MNYDNVLSKIKESPIWHQKFKDLNDVLENAILKADFLPEQCKAIVNLNITSHFVLEFTKKFLKRIDSSIPQKNVLEALCFCDKKYMTQNQLSKFIFTSKSNISGLLLRMEEKGLIKRCENNSNKREKIVLITEQGIEKLDNISKELFKIDLEYLISKEDAILLNDILLRFKNNMKHTKQKWNL